MIPLSYETNSTQSIPLGYETNSIQSTPSNSLNSKPNHVSKLSRLSKLSRQLSAPNNTDQPVSPTSSERRSLSETPITQLVTNEIKTPHGRTSTSPKVSTPGSNKLVNAKLKAGVGWAKTNLQKPKSISSSSLVPANAQTTIEQISTISLAITKSPAARKLFTTTVTSTTIHSSLAKPLPKPIGSNRPPRQPLTPSTALSSTSVDDSIASTLHSTLTSLLSQVATQRSPMIWNDHNGNKEQLCGDTVLTVVTSSPTSLVNCNTGDRYLPHTVSQNSSQDSSFKGHSRTPSLSPTSNNSNSPTPEERPHLNPIGSERGLKKPLPKQMTNLPALPSLLHGKLISLFALLMSLVRYILFLFACYVWC